MLHTPSFVAFGCVHIPHHNPIALEIVCRVIDRLKPDTVLCLGDLMDCGQFSFHPPTYELPESSYEDDLAKTQDLLDRLQASCKKLVLVEGNHEYRLNRWAAATSEGRGAYSMLAPRQVLPKNRKAFVYVPYGPDESRYPHYAVNNRIVAVHGWSYARNATKAHLDKSQGKSILHAHTHRADVCFAQSIWKTDGVLQARSVGCLCKPIPLYGTGAPVEWINAFVMGYQGRRSDTLYTIPILGERCILPDGQKITAK